jgi:cytochrome c-type biogenesis protein CcmH/NrfG
LVAPQTDGPSDEHYQQQMEAQTHLTQGNIEAAMHNYNELIQQGQRLDDIIDDLEKAAEQLPGEIPIIKTLGDAYMQAGNFQDALDAYSRAEELLR